VRVVAQGDGFVLVDAVPREGDGPGFGLASPGRITPTRDRVAFRPHWAHCRGVHPSLLRGAVN